MKTLFQPIRIGALDLPNRFMRSATAERQADPRTGAPKDCLADMYRTLADGGVGLIVTGHCFVDVAGRAHPEMASIADDARIAEWRRIIRPAQRAGARLRMQLNHSGASCDPSVTPNPVSPSGIATGEATPRAATEEEILAAARAFGLAAARARAAGFDGVQIHGAHGYLVSQFLTPRTNHRADAWGGDPVRRRAFLRAVTRSVRQAVGADYPVWIKLGVAGSAPEPLTVEEGAGAAAACIEEGIEAIEISNGLGAPEGLPEAIEPCFLPLAQVVRAAVGPTYPLALVNGYRTLAAMEDSVASGLVQLVSLCRPLIAEPDLPNKLREGRATVASCAGCGNCWPKEPGEGVACHNAGVQRRLSAERSAL